MSFEFEALKFVNLVNFAVLRFAIEFLITNANSCVNIIYM